MADETRVTAKTIMKDAMSEMNEELIADLKEQAKMRIRSLKQAKFIVKNIERELEDLEIAIKEKLE